MRTVHPMDRLADTQDDDMVPYEYTTEIDDPSAMQIFDLGFDFKAKLCVLPTATNGNDDVSLSNCSDTWDGLAGHDDIDAKDGNDQVHGGEGNDDILGGAGHDTLWGDEGADDLDGGDGNDILFGGAGHDYLSGGDGNDQMFGGDSWDYMWGGDGFDLMQGGDGHDFLMGQNDADTMYGGNGNDDLDGGQGNDQIHGGAGEDTLNGGTGRDELFGGSGGDLFYFSDNSTGVGANSDRIWDFSQAEGDIIAPIYSDDSGPFADQIEFEFVGYTYNKNTLTNGQLGYFHTDDDTRVVGREDGNLFEIEIVDKTLDLTLNDFAVDAVV